jgi:hypothetical protein
MGHGYGFGLSSSIQDQSASNRLAQFDQTHLGNQHQFERIRQQFFTTAVLSSHRSAMICPAASRVYYPTENR